MSAFYSEFDPQKAAWLRELIRRDLIAPGVVDERDIWDVAPTELAGYTQVHLFAGIGVWSYAARLAGWADDEPLWSLSCPCQPFSAAGKGGGFADDRHLWPAAHWLIQQCRPPVLFGEQVASSLVMGPARSQKGTGQRVPAHLQDEESCQRSCETCQGEGCEAWSAFRSGSAHTSTTGEDSCELLRSYGTSVRSAEWPNLGQPIAGQDRAGKRLSVQQCASGSSRPQLCDGGMGCADPDCDDNGNPESAALRVERLVATFGGQVQTDGSTAWFDVVCADLERAGYTIGALDTPAASVGAPHIRQRLYFVAHTAGERQFWRRLGVRSATACKQYAEAERGVGGSEIEEHDAVGQLADASGQRVRATGCGETRDSTRGPEGEGDQRQRFRSDAGAGCAIPGRLAYALSERGCGGEPRHENASDARLAKQAGSVADADDTERWSEEFRDDQPNGTEAGRQQDASGPARHRSLGDPGPTNGFWRDADWLLCRDGKWRPARPGSFPLATRAASRLVRLRGYGDAICAPLAAEFLKAVRGHTRKGCA